LRRRHFFLSRLAKGRHARIAHLLLVDGDPVDVGEKLVSFDVGHAALHVTEPFCDVHLQQVLDQVAKIGSKRWWKPNLKNAKK